MEQEEVKQPVEMTKEEFTEYLHNMWQSYDDQYQVIKQYLKERDELAKQIAERLGVGHHWQDEDGTVYQVGRWQGTFVAPKEYQVDRTRREGEKQGGLSLTAARELGYIVEGKAAKPIVDAIPESETAGHPGGK